MILSKNLYQFNSTQLKFFNFIHHHRCKYTVCDYVVTKRKTSLNPPSYAKINSILHDISSGNLFYLIEDCITGEYLPHLTGFLVNHTNDTMRKLLSIENIAHYYPLNTYSVRNELNQKITVKIPKYAL